MHGKGSLQGKDAISISKGENIIIDHCSASWSLDEDLSASTKNPSLSNVTVQWCFITEGLNPSNHGFGSLIRGTGGAKYSFIYNLYAHNKGRNPRPGNYDSNPHNEDPKGFLLDFSNNVIYNWGGEYAGYNNDSKSVTKLNYVGNYLIPGANSENNGIAYRTGSTYNRGYFASNYFDGKKPHSEWNIVKFRDSWSDDEISEYKQSKSFKVDPMDKMKATESFKKVVESGGASLPKRDAVDERLVKDVKNRTGKIIKSQEEVGGWPELASAPAPKDSDKDGIPDSWEKKNNLNPNNSDDGNKIAEDGYTMLEKYINNIK
jgi:hypothetical protein